MSEKDLIPCPAIQCALDAAGIKLGQLCCVTYDGSKDLDGSEVIELTGSFSLDAANDLLLFSTKNAEGNLTRFNNFWLLGGDKAVLPDLGFISVTPVILADDTGDSMAESEDVTLTTPCSDGGACSRRCKDYDFCGFADRLPDDDLLRSNRNNAPTYTPPAAFPLAHIDSKREILLGFCRERGLEILKDELHVSVSAYQMLKTALRVRVGGIPGFKRGVTLYINVNGNDSRVYVLGKEIYCVGEKCDLEIYSKNSIVREDPLSGSKGTKYPVHEVLTGAYIYGVGGYSAVAMPMEDAIKLCKLYAKGTKFRSYEIARMLRAAPTVHDAQFGY